jgi:hypothetical protein
LKEEVMSRLAVVTTLLALVGCTDNYSVIILRVIDPTDVCLISPSETLSLGDGFLDVTAELPDGTLNPGYLFTPEIRNLTLAPTVSGTRPGNPNAHIFFMRGAEVQVLAGPDPASEAAVLALQAANLASRTILTSGTIEPNGTLGTGFLVFDNDMLRAMQGAIPAGTQTQVVVRVVAFGQIDDAEIETPPFDYPVTLCEGCLLFDFGFCEDLPGDISIPTGGECTPLGDGALACCTTASGIVLCPAQPVAAEE